MVNVIRFYKTPGLNASETKDRHQKLEKLCSDGLGIKGITTETCFYVETQESLTDQEILQIRWILANVLDPNSLTDISRLPLRPDDRSIFFEIGPRYHTTF